jgi:hypothetical protein
MKRLDVSKILFYAISITGLLSLTFAFGLYSAAKNTVVYETVKALKNSVEESLNLVSEEASTLTKVHPKHFLAPARYDGSGVTVNDFADSEEELIFLSGFFNESNELRLIQRDGTVIVRWPVSFSEIFPDTSHLNKPPLWKAPETDWNIDIHGALALPDGSVVFNFEYGGLVKLDRCGNIVWTLGRSSHHSVERAESGGFWVPGRRYVSSENDSPFPPFETPFKEDTIMKVSEGGKVLTEISVPKLFYDNGLEALLTATGHWFKRKMHWDREIVHLNKIEELSSTIAKDFPMFEAGDLAISLREQNLVMVINPHTGKIKWWRIGPWLRQHDPEFASNGKIIVFNNNDYSSTFKNKVSDGNILYISNIVELDIASDEYRIIYGGKKGEELATRLRGKHELTRNGGLLVTEYEGGRVFETDATGRIIWEYINRYDSDEVAEISEARVYPASYFRVSDWSCE